MANSSTRDVPEGIRSISKEDQEWFGKILDMWIKGAGRKFPADIYSQEPIHRVGGPSTQRPCPTCHGTGKVPLELDQSHNRHLQMELGFDTLGDGPAG